MISVYSKPNSTNNKEQQQAKDKGHTQNRITENMLPAMILSGYFENLGPSLPNSSESTVRHMKCIKCLKAPNTKNKYMPKNVYQTLMLTPLQTSYKSLECAKTDLRCSNEALISASKRRTQDYHSQSLKA